MDFDTALQHLKGVPFISEANARFLYDWILEKKPTRILELGIAHGTASCYMAAALQELGRGTVTAVDLVEAAYTPSAEEQVATMGLGDYVTIHRMQTGYTWFLHDEIKRLTQDNVCRPIYDLCIIDGPKNWTIDGCAFFLVEKLLKPSGWLFFDDYAWTYGDASHTREATDGITHRRLSKAERETPHIRDVFELLVKQHPHFSEFYVHADGDWAYAQKNMAPQKTYTLVYRESYRDLLVRLYYKAKAMTLKEWRTRIGDPERG